ncbi:hypothetical protein [Catellatospora coxensis]|nr:hypothetical protein [Catellatospora coxensis]
MSMNALTILAVAAEEQPPALSVALAVEDFAPTLLAFAGFLLLAPSALGRIGAVLMGAGGASKSTWKLLHAAWSIEVDWLDDLLFPLLAAGGLLLALSLHQSLRWWRWPLLLIGAGVATLAVQARSVQPAFIFATVIVIWISVLGTIRAWKHGNALAAGLFPVSVLAVIVLVPLRGHAASDALAFQWVQQGMNTMAQGIFFVAALLTYRAVKGKGQDFSDADTVTTDAGQQWPSGEYSTYDGSRRWDPSRGGERYESQGGRRRRL